MNIRYLLVLAASMALAGNAFAGDGEALAKKANCTTMCHDVNAKKMGPAFKEVSAKYKSDKGAQAMLEKRVRDGSGSEKKWGNAPMPATAKSVSDDDIKSIVQWILSLK